MRKQTAIDEYMSRIYKGVFILIFTAIACACILTFSFKAFGFYEDISWPIILTFCTTDIIYIIIAVILVKKTIVNGIIIRKMASISKVILFIILMIQFNFLLWMLPSKEFYMSAFFFLILLAFFFDQKLIIVSITGYSVSLIIAFLLKKNYPLMPESGILFTPELLWRIAITVYSFLAVYLITIFGSKYLIDANEELRIEKDNAELANKAKSNFLASTSHEIRTPMNAIVGMTELILMEDISPAILERTINIKQASASLLAIINDILDLSKIESGQMTIISADYALSSLVNDIISIIRMRIGEKQLHFTVNIDPTLPDNLIGDEIRIRQIILNLLSNAVKYTEEGFVSFDIEGEVKDDESVQLNIKITDSGIGIKEEEQSKIFDDFVQIDLTKNKGIEGTGLGLAIVRRLCELMGGDITINSKYGEGSTFYVKLPQKYRANMINDTDESKPKNNNINVSQFKTFAHVDNPKEKLVLLFVMRQIYAESISRLLEKLEVPYKLIQKQSMVYEELKNNRYDFIIVSSLMAEGVKRMIEKQETDAKLIMLSENNEVIDNKNIRTLQMPVYAIPVANILNNVNEQDSYSEVNSGFVRFVAPNASILIVDDINTNLKVAEGLMLPYKFKIDLCRSGREAIELVKVNSYDLVFMDHMMPEMDGIEAAAQIRKLEDGTGKFKKLPIIALTANAITGAKEMFLQNDIDDYLSKPIDLIKLNSILEKWIPKEKQERYIKEDNKDKSSERKVPDIGGVDVEKGINMTGGKPEHYYNMLSVYYAEGTEKIKEIKTSFENKDIKLLYIYAHSLKSSSASIGADKISELAKLLEAAAKKGDIDYIEKNVEYFLTCLEETLSNIYPVINKKDDTDDFAGEREYEILKEELIKLKEAVDGMEVGIADSILNELKHKKWNNSIDNLISKISQNVLISEYDIAIELINEALEQITVV